MTPNNEARHLSVAIGLPLLGGLSPDEHARVLRHARVFTFLRDQPIFRVGEPATAVYFLLDGLVKVMYGNPRGDESTIAIFQSGDTFGELFLGKYRFRVGTAVALLPTRIASIAENDLIDLFEQIPRFSLNFMRHLADRNREALARMHALMHVDARSRLLGVLYNLSRHHCCGRDDWFELPDAITQSDIATMSCLNRSTVSLLLNDLRRTGILGGSGRTLRVNDPAVHAILEDAGLEILT